jgi:hypothetical protein
MLAIKLAGYCTVSCLRRDIGRDYAKMEIEGIFEKNLNIQAFVRSKGEKSTSLTTDTRQSSCLCSKA